MQGSQRDNDNGKIVKAYGKRKYVQILKTFLTTKNE